MGIVRYALPTMLLLFFVVRSLRQRIFLVGLPFLMYASSSVFFENVRVFWVPGRLDPMDHVMLWLLVVWLLYFDLLLPSTRRSRERSGVFGPALSPPEETVLLGLLALAGLQLVLTAMRYGDPGALLDTAKGFLYLFGGYFMLRGMFCRASRADTLDFIKALVIVNTIAAGLFLLHQGFRLPVYVATEYQTLIFMGQRITRSFYFMPQLLALAIAYVAARRTWNALWAAVMLLSLAAIWVSYTRSLLVIAVVVICLVLGVRLLKERQAPIVVRRAATLLGLVAVLAAVAVAVLPVQSQYFMSRIGMTTAAGGVASDPNLQNRMQKIERVYTWIGSDGRLVGAGFASRSQDAAAAEVRTMSSDLVWVPVLYRFGVIGVALVALLYALTAWRALRLSLSGSADAEFLALVLLGVVVGTFLEGFVSWTILNPVRYPMGLWVFALVAAEACRCRAERAADAVRGAAHSAEALDA